MFRRDPEMAAAVVRSALAETIRSAVPWMTRAGTVNRFSAAVRLPAQEPPSLGVVAVWVVGAVVLLPGDLSAPNFVAGEAG